MKLVEIGGAEDFNEFFLDLLGALELEVDLRLRGTLMREGLEDKQEEFLQLRQVKVDFLVNTM